jgi:NNP family nitrate/nitrite transporter-like MFS transporter
MALGVGSVLVSLRMHSFPHFLGSFLVLFVASGIGNGSTYRMIPAIFRAEAMRTAGDGPEAAARGSARGAGRGSRGHRPGVGRPGIRRFPHPTRLRHVDRAHRLDRSGARRVPYGVCLAVTWWYYLRTVLVGFSPSLAEAAV